MWRYPFFNLCFAVLVMGLLTLQHSGNLFPPTSAGVGDGEREQPYSWPEEGVSRADAAATFGQVAAALSDTWRRGMVLKQWLMEYNISQWELFRSSNPAESELLEARFHVANAEVFTEVARENDRAIKELDRAAKSLEVVRTTVKADLMARLSSVQEEMKVAEVRERAGDSLSTASFEAIKTDLDHLIEILRVANA